MTPLLKPPLPSKRLRSLQPSTVSTSNTINVITDDVLTTTPSNCVSPAANSLLSVAWTPISRIELPSTKFGTCRRAPASSYSMLVLPGWQQCILLCGHVPCAMLPFSTAVCQCWRMGHQGLSYSAQLEYGAIMCTLLPAQCSCNKMHWLQASHYLDGPHVPG